MNWYVGEIIDGIHQSKKQAAVFGVAIFGEDDTSRQLEASLNQDETQNALNSGKFVFIRIEANSELHRQFAQIYNDAPSGSIYLIGDKGSLLSVTKTVKTSTELKLMLEEAWTRHTTPVESSHTSPGTSGPAPTATPTLSAAATASRLDNKTAQALVNANEALRQAEEAVGQADLTLEQKIERAQQLASAKRQQKLAQEADDERQREKERRGQGKGMAELKRWQEEEETKRAIEERKKDKLEELELRRRVKEQIAQDRVARNARTNVSFLTEGPVNPDQPSTSPPGSRPVGVGITTPSTRDYTGQARLQFRMPTGASISQGFDPDATTLANVRDFLINNNHVLFRQFNLSLAYPRRQFTSLEYSSTLRDLDLLPSAAILVLPISGSNSIPGLSNGSGLGNWLSIIISYLFIPFTFIYSFFQRALTSSGGTSTSSDSSRSPSVAADAASKKSGPTPSSSASSSSSLNFGGDTSADIRNRKGNKGENIKKQESKKGNIHQLRTDDGDSEDGTWNGNSTQQM